MLHSGIRQRPGRFGQISPNRGSLGRLTPEVRAGEALDECRRRVQLAIHGHRGRKGDPLYSARRTLCTGADLLTDTQSDRVAALFADDAHVEVLTRAM